MDQNITQATADLTATEAARRRIHTIRERLNLRFVERNDASDALICAAIAREPCLFVGAPGSAKSNMISSFCDLLGFGAGPEALNAALFQYLLTEFTVPEELFGYPDLKKFESGGEFARDDAHMVQNASIIFLDEVFNASSALLNSMLSLLNERCFYDRGRRRPASYHVFLGATQYPPERRDLMALYDRFTIRVDTNWVAEESQLGMLALSLESAISETSVAGLSDLETLGLEVDRRTSAIQASIQADDVEDVSRYLRVINHLRALNVTISDRRIVKLLRLLVARAVVEDRPVFEPDGLWMLRFALDDPSNESTAELLHRAVYFEE